MINILSIESDLQFCVASQLEVKIDEVKPVRDLSRKIRKPHLELVIGCEAITVNISDKDGVLSTVPINARASVLSEHPGTDLIDNLPKSASRLKVKLMGMTRRIRVVASTGQMGQQCLSIVNQVTPAVFQWLLRRDRSQ